MKKILIIPASASGHIIATLKIAKILRNNGYIITYLVDNNTKHLVQEQGFEVFVCNTFLFFNSDFMGIFESMKKGFVENLLNRIGNNTLNATINNLFKFEESIEKINPDHIILDVFMSYNYILLKNKRPTTFMQTQLSTYQDTYTPPLTSSLLPHQTTLIQLDWLKYKIKRNLNLVLNCGETPWILTQRALKKLNRSFDYSLLDWNKCFHVGIKNVPEWVSSPLEFDFPKDKTKPYQKHIGPTTDIERNEVHDILYDKWVHSTTGKKIIYCSLGTISSAHNKNSFNVLKKIAEAFSLRPDLELLISCGDVDINQLGVVAPNIKLLKRVPQLDAIKRCSLMITHGGINTVMECILLGKPMLAFPLSNKWDLNGTTARIVYHQLGLSCTMNQLNPSDILSKVDKVVNTVTFKENVLKMQAIFQKRNDEFESAILNEIENNKIMAIA